MAKNPHLKGILDDMVRVQKAQNHILERARKCDIAIICCEHDIKSPVTALLPGDRRYMKLRLQELQAKQVQLAEDFKVNQKALDTIRENINSPLTIF